LRGYAQGERLWIFGELSVRLLDARTSRVDPPQRGG